MCFRRSPWSRRSATFASCSAARAAACKSRCSMAPVTVLCSTPPIDGAKCSSASLPLWNRAPKRVQRGAAERVGPFAGLAGRRLPPPRLPGKCCPGTAAATRWLGAVRSQDYGGAKWALGQRTRGVPDAEIDRLYDEGAILRTHVMRPTWHFVVPEDIRWMLELTGPKIRRALAARYRALELDEETVARALVAFRSALAGGGHMTRPQLGEVLDAAKISPAGQRLPHLLM